MSELEYILAIDEGTTGCTALLIDKAGKIAARFIRSQVGLSKTRWIFSIRL
jgi:glycerol kinase